MSTVLRLPPEHHPAYFVGLARGFRVASMLSARSHEAIPAIRDIWVRAARSHNRELVRALREAKAGTS